MRKSAIRMDLINTFRKQTGITLRESTLCVEAMVNWVIETLEAGGTIELRGLGTFEVKQMPERKFSSVHSSKSVIPAHGKVVFRPCNKLKMAVWNQKE